METFSSCQSVPSCEEPGGISAEDEPRRKREEEEECLLNSTKEIASVIGLSLNGNAEEGASFRLVARLKDFKGQLKGWNRDVFKRVEVEIAAGLGLVDELDKREEAGPLSEEDRVRRITIKCQLDRLWKFEEISWRQKAREAWIREGDRNTKFYHRIANFNRRRNQLDSMWVGEVRMEGQRDIARAAVDFYEQLYKESIPIRPFASEVQSFVWMAWYKKIATIDNLQRRGMQLTNMCVLCCKDLETVNHLLLTCEFATNVWNRISSGLSIFGPNLVDITEFVLGWKGMNCNPNFSVVMKCLLHATLWFIWIERNNRIFKEKTLSHKQVAIKILINLGN
ncbi:hypothetical protein LINPERHAP1_LOCUS22080 [Linum perenne]